MDVYGSPVEPDQLRLLRPVSASPHALRFSLVVAPRRRLPEYTAISYTWGDEAASEEILLDGRRFPVRPNLWSCLYHLATGPGSGSAEGRPVRYLWADAVCINQGDDAEKAGQVRNMDWTYREADSVVVWLGLPPVVSAGGDETESDGHINNDDDDTSVQDRRFPVSGTFGAAGDLDWIEAMDDLANRPYWSRFWVIQECLLAARVVIRCGAHAVAWGDFADRLLFAAGWHDVAEDPYYSYGGDAAAPPSRHKAAAAARFRCWPLVVAAGRGHPDRFPNVRGAPLRDLLAAHRGARCRDPRDRVFALLGLVADDERAALLRFFPNYAMAPRHVLVVALAHMTQYAPLSSSRAAGAVVVITDRSDDIFSGFGVRGQAERKRLLAQAASFDYVGFVQVEGSSPGQLYEAFKDAIEAAGSELRDRLSEGEGLDPDLLEVETAGMQDGDREGPRCVVL